MNNSILMINANRFSLLVLSALLLSGCGKKIPECGDPSVINVLNSIVPKLVNQDQLLINLNAEQILLSINPHLIKNNEKSALVFVTNGTTVTTQNMKLDGFSSTKKDKDSGVNYCSAIESGEEVIEIHLTYSKDIIELIDSSSNPLAAMVLAGIPSVVNAMEHPPTEVKDMKDIANLRILQTVELVNQNGLSQFKSIIPEMKSVVASPLSDGLLIKIVKTIPSSISYTANLTDKGDQVLVSVTSTGQAMK